MVIKLIGEVVDVQLGRPSLQVDLHVAVWNGGDPKDPVAEAITPDVTNGRTKARVEIMDLIRKGCQVRLTWIEVESDFDESTLVQIAVQPPVGPLHEAHVRVEEKSVAMAVLAVA